MKIQYRDGAKHYDAAVCYYYGSSLPSYTKTYYNLVDNEKVIGMFSFSIGYMFCCGMREIGGFDGPYGKEPFPTDEVEQFRAALCDLLTDDNDLGGVGAFTLTEHIYPSGRRFIPMLWQQLIDTWPKASHSNPFYNPNSGNNVIQWILPIPGRTSREEMYGDAEEEY